MRFVSFKANQQLKWGAVIDDGVVDLHEILGGSLKEFIRDQRINEAIEAAQNNTATYQLGNIKLLPPIVQPRMVICVGVNYANRNAEYKDGSVESQFTYPSLFLRTAESFTGHDQPLWRPPESEQLDYEGEIVAVIGKRGRRIKQEEALDFIAGLTLMNEGTIRDWVNHSKFNNTQGKNFVNSGAIGPWMVSADEFSKEKYETMRIVTSVNGEVRQDDTAANMRYSIAYQISYISTFIELQPGDMIATGTPTGAGARFTPPRYLSPGDTIKVSVNEIGTLCNGVINEPIEE